MLFHDSTGTSYRLSRPVGQGGEATIYRVVEHPHLLAKIFKKSRPEYETKLAWMRDHPPDDPSAGIGHASIAWPTHLIYKKGGVFAGYLMPYIKEAAQLLVVFNPRLRTRTLPDFDARYLHRTARNLAAALGALHAREYVVGDLNESNIMVTPTTLVTMIDTDSFQVRTRTRIGKIVTYPCPVGKFEYLPPELQARSLKNVVRTPEHDRFALAVLIFQLLMEGSHPFRARWVASGDPPPLEERIHRGLFPYKRGRKRPVEPPVNALPLNSLHPRLEGLFRRCFIKGHDSPAERPTPEDWEKAISLAEKALKPCGQGHYYSDHLRVCPYCPRASRPRAEKKAQPVPSPEEILSQLIQKVPRKKRSKPVTRPPSPATAKTHLKPPARAIPIVRPGILRGAQSPGLTNQLQRIGHTFERWVRGPIGTVMLFAVVGGIGSGLLVSWLGAPTGGAIAGGVGGLLSGGMLSETIHKRVGWSATLGIMGALGAGWWVWQAGYSTFAWAMAAGLGAAVGFLTGGVGRRSFWTAFWAIAGAISGGFLENAIVSATGTPWAGGAALGGGLIWLLTGIIHQAWQRFGR